MADFRPSMNSVNWRAAACQSTSMLKRAMRFALCLHNPEKQFHKSDYYPFLQRLFVADEPKLRDDVSILSFNNDPYLEFLVGRALDHRWRAYNGGTKFAPLSLRNTVESGMLDPKADITQESGFCILKLHGSVAQPEQAREEDQHEVCHKHLFEV